MLGQLVSNYYHIKAIAICPYFKCCWNFCFWQSGEILGLYENGVYGAPCLISSFCYLNFVSIFRLILFLMLNIHILSLLSILEFWKGTLILWWTWTYIVWSGGYWASLQLTHGKLHGWNSEILHPSGSSYRTSVILVQEWHVDFI